MTTTGGPSSGGSSATMKLAVVDHSPSTGVSVLTCQKYCWPRVSSLSAGSCAPGESRAPAPPPSASWWRCSSRVEARAMALLCGNQRSPPSRPGRARRRSSQTASPPVASPCGRFQEACRSVLPARSYCLTSAGPGRTATSIPQTAAGGNPTHRVCSTGVRG